MEPVSGDSGFISEKGVGGEFGYSGRVIWDDSADHRCIVANLLE